MKTEETPNKPKTDFYKDDKLVLLSDPEQLMTLDGEFVMRFITCKTGFVTIHHKGTDIQLNPSEMMFLPQSVDNNMLIIRKSEDYIGSAFACKTGLVKKAFQFNTTMRNIAVYMHKHPVIQWDLDESLSITIRDIFLYATRERNALFQEEMVRSLFLFLLFAIISKIAEKADRADERMLNRGEVVFMKFLGMLNQHFREEREVAYYADMLHLSPKYLSAICKEQSGKSASVWINEAVVEEIRYQLLHSDLSVKEICVMMNFPNISFFGRYVKKHLGHSPQAFRKLVHVSPDD